MDFGVLGPLEVSTADGRPLPLGPPKQRAVLALLLTEANRVLSVGRIVEALWGEHPPRTAVKNVQVYVYQLRKVLGERLVSRAPGYQLVVGPEELDLACFTGLLGRARAARAAGDPALAAGLFREALDVWRGPALTDLATSGLLTSVAAGLDELRLAARTDYADVELAMGRHSEVLAELTAWVSEHPTHERLREQLMRALHLSGRSTEALAAYRDAHRQLVTQVGVEPGPALRRLHAEILGAAQGPHGHRPPRELPADLVGFAGRAEELGELHRLAATARSTGRVCLSVITGQAGIGKSALATRAAHELAVRCPDGQLHADLSGADPTRALARFLRALGESRLPAEPDELAARYRSATAQRRLLVLLDNATSADQVRPLLPTGPGSTVLVTSRRPLADLEGASYLRLARLPFAAAAELLAAVAGAARVAADPDGVRELVERCDALPLALRIAAARLAARPGWPVAALAGRLADERGRLDELRLGDVAVRTAFIVSYQQLRDPAAATAFRLLGLVDGTDIATAEAGVLLGGDHTAVLAELTDANLLDEPVPGRHRMHDLLRLFARERCESEDTEADRAAALGRLHRHLVDTLTDARRVVERPDGRPGTVFADTDAALTWLETERANLIVAARQADPALAVPLAKGLSWYFRRRSDLADWTALNEAALAAAREVGDRTGEAQALLELGSAEDRAYRLAPALAYYDAALEIAVELGNRALQASLLNNLGVVHLRLRELDRARERLAASHALRMALSDGRGAGNVLINLGLVAAADGDHRTALRRYGEAHELCRAIGNATGEAHSLANIAEAQRELGMLADAARCAEKALAMARELGDRQFEAGLILDLGLVHELAGRCQLADERYRDGLALCRRIGYRWGEGEALRRQGMRAAARGDRCARTLLGEALVVFEELNAPEAVDVRRSLQTGAGAAVR